jgi:hypothetical protein
MRFDSSQGRLGREARISAAGATIPVVAPLHVKICVQQRPLAPYYMACLLGSSAKDCTRALVPVQVEYSVANLPKITSGGICSGLATAFPNALAGG